MDCRRALSLLGALSADDLPEASALSLREHLGKCPQCQQEWHLFQDTLFTVSSLPQSSLTPDDSSKLWRNCSREIHIRIEEQRTRGFKTRQPSPFGGWFRQQPAWGWAALGGAAAILGSVWFLAPNSPSPNGGLPIGPPPTGPGVLVTFEQPPSNAIPLVNHHAATAFDPFTDHVGSTLISYSATASGQ